ncbi:hypothetical protein AMJ86_05270 [bacterium SM23_57]|nr:MAG: hypothetical protein AMJ86_05270 [bacterium SM23_57]
MAEIKHPGNIGVVQLFQKRKFPLQRSDFVLRHHGFPHQLQREQPVDHLGIFNQIHFPHSPGAQQRHNPVSMIQCGTRIKHPVVPMLLANMQCLYCYRPGQQFLYTLNGKKL